MAKQEKIFGFSFGFSVGALVVILLIGGGLFLFFNTGTDFIIECRVANTVGDFECVPLDQLPFPNLQKGIICREEDGVSNEECLETLVGFTRSSIGGERCVLKSISGEDIETRLIATIRC